MQVVWDQHKCCHAGVCIQSLPAVFKIQEGEFVIDVSKAAREEIIDVVNQCPSGALTLTTKKSEER